MVRRLLLGFALLSLLVPGRSSAQTPLTSAPNDPDVDRQWAIEKIGLQCAWGHTTGSSDVTVAVIDSGIDLNHPDLVDVIRNDGFDFYNNNPEPVDENGHGTHVAGIIAASLNNDEGIAGVAGGGTRILPIRVMAADGSGTNEDIVAGIRYATEKRVQIINMSLGSMLPLGSEDIVAAIQEAHEAGVLVIVAAGNSFVPLPNFAFGIEEYAMVIAATDPDDRKTDFSNYGKWIAVSAPGDGIYSTMPTYDVFLTSELPPEERFNKKYDALSGTSQATPIIAGIAALLFAEHPDWDADQVRAEIQRTATDVSEQNPTKAWGPITYFEASNLGAGRVNACDALGGPVNGVGASSLTEADDTLPLLIGLGVLALLVVAGAIVLVRRKRAAPALANSPYAAHPYIPPAPQGQPQAYPPPNQAAYGPPPNQASYAPPPNQTAYAPPAAPPAQPQAYPPTVAATPAGQAWAKLTVEQGAEPGRFFLLRGESIDLGRDPSTQIPLSSDSTVSRRHAQITRDAHGATIVDLGSSHGTLINGRPLSGAQLLRAGDHIQIGQTILRYDA